MTFVAALALGATIGCQGGTGAASAGDPLANGELPAPAPSLSQFNVPLDYDFTPVMATVEKAVPKTFGSMATVRQVGDDKNRHYAFEATRGPFTAFVVGSQVHLRTTLSYQARGYYKPKLGPTIQAGCGKGDDRPKITVELVTPLTVDSTWHLQSAARLARLEPATKTDADRCKVSILHLDVTDKVIDAARQGLTSQLPGINKKIRAVSLATQASGWWTMLNRPIQLRDGVWLVLDPTRLRVGKVTGKGRILTIDAGIDAHPRIVTGREPMPVTSELPALAPADSAKGFNIVVDGQIDYATVSKTLTDALRGKPITVKGRTVTIESLSASGKSGGRIALKVDFKGAARGTLDLVGAPKFYAADGEIRVPDLDYNLETNNSLVDVVAWVKSDELRAMLREKAQIPVAPVLERGKELLTSGLNRTIGTSMTLAATVDSVSVVGLYVRRPGIFVRAGARGNAQVSVRQQPKKK